MQNIKRIREFRPFKVTFTLSSPLAMTYPWINFDGIIAHLLLRYKDPKWYRCLPSTRPIKLKIEFPLKTMTVNNITIYHASVSILKSDVKYTTTIYKKFYSRGIYTMRGKWRRVELARGKFRAFMIRLPTIATRTVDFYGNGDIDFIEKLLEGLPALGKKHSVGYGFIKDYKIKEIKKDYSIVKGKIAMRPIPINFVKYAKELFLLAYKPPYWAKENVTLCVPPFTECVLK